jgi:hypothetical protein
MLNLLITPDRTSPRAKRRAPVLVASAVVAGLLCVSPAQAARPIQTRAATPSFVSFDAFRAEVSGARYEGLARPGPEGGVRSRTEFEHMRSYVRSMYRDVKVSHSYVLDGSYFDCVSVTSQPTVRALGISTIATPPALSRVSAGTTAPRTAARSPLTQGLTDRFGNAIACPRRTIPMMRMSLERLTSFRTLADFLAKDPAGLRAVKRPGIPPADSAPHRYAVGRQVVTNYGGNSWINLWNPSGEFTLSQQWFHSGSGSTTQTVEGGWVHYPAKFGDRSVLFIFSTPDGYATGCYNLDCVGFVQTNRNWALGGAWSAYSTYGGTQYGFQQQWKYFNGNWWLFLRGSGAALEAVGYYPGTVFNGGQMSRNATLADFGGETFTGGSSWPQMGSGKFASQGWAQAAYQKTIWYIPRNESGGTGVWASLDKIEPNPACYTINITPASSGGSWGTYFFYGGPGGNC